MPGQGFAKPQNSKEFLAELEFCQDSVEQALQTSDIIAVIDIDAQRHFLLDNAIESGMMADSDSDILKLKELQSRASASLDILRELMTGLGVNAGRHKRALIGYRDGA